MYGYCSKCDYKLFSPIEVPEPKVPRTDADFCRYSLRPISHEIRKKEGNVQFLRTRDGRAQQFINREGEIELSRWKSEQLQIETLRAILSTFTEGISSDIPISFIVREIPRIEICASSAYLEPSKLYVSPKNMQAAFQSFKGHDFGTINIFPVEDTAFLVYGTHEHAGDNSQRLVSRIETVGTDELTKLVSNMLIAQIEDWCISESLYKKLPSNFQKIITRAKTHQNRYFDDDFGINLFDL